MGDAPRQPDDGGIHPLYATVVPVPVARPIYHPFVQNLPARRNPIYLDSEQRLVTLWDIALLTTLLILLDFTAGYAVASYKGIALDPSTIEATQQTLILPIIGIRATCSILFVGVILMLRRQTPAAIGLSFRQFGVNVLLGIGAGVGVLFFGQMLIMLMTLIWPEILKQMNKNAEELMKLIPRLTTFESVFFMLAVGTYEEVLFRGFLLPRLRRLTGSWTWATLISTTIFTSLHALDQVGIALVAITGLSFIFSAMTIWRRSIVPGIAAHFLFNLVQILMMNWMRNQPSP